MRAFNNVCGAESAGSCRSIRVDGYRQALIKDSLSILQSFAVCRVETVWRRHGIVSVREDGHGRQLLPTLNEQRSGRLKPDEINGAVEVPAGNVKR